VTPGDIDIARSAVERDGLEQQLARHVGLAGGEGKAEQDFFRQIDVRLADLEPLAVVDPVLGDEGVALARQAIPDRRPRVVIARLGAGVLTGLGAERAAPPERTNSASMFTSLMSFTITAIRLPSRLRRM
jgi:hypothetical protein